MELPRSSSCSSPARAHRCCSCASWNMRELSEEFEEGVWSFCPAVARHVRSASAPVLCEACSIGTKIFHPLHTPSGSCKIFFSDAESCFLSPSLIFFRQIFPQSFVEYFLQVLGFHRAPKSLCAIFFMLIVRGDSLLLSLSLFVSFSNACTCTKIHTNTLKRALRSIRGGKMGVFRKSPLSLAHKLYTLSSSPTHRNMRAITGFVRDFLEFLLCWCSPGLCRDTMGPKAMCTNFGFSFQHSIDNVFDIDEKS